MDKSREAGLPDVLTVPQVAERLNVKPETVRRMLRRGELPGWLIGGRAGYRIFRRHVDELMERRGAEHGGINASEKA